MGGGPFLYVWGVRWKISSTWVCVWLVKRYNVKKKVAGVGGQSQWEVRVLFWYTTLSHINLHGFHGQKKNLLGFP